VKKLTWTVKIFNFVFERILFLLTFMLMFLIIFALMIQLTDEKSRYIMMSKEFNLLGSAVAISILVTMICAVILNGLFPGTLLFPMLMKQYYPPIYFIYQSTFIFLLAFDFTQQYILFIL
jgi:FlaA1/EpsC-like NDP-sugar epimerase